MGIEEIVWPDAVDKYVLCQCVTKWKFLKSRDFRSDRDDYPALECFGMQIDDESLSAAGEF